MSLPRTISPTSTPSHWELLRLSPHWSVLFQEPSTSLNRQRRITRRKRSPPFERRDWRGVVKHNRVCLSITHWLSVPDRRLFTQRFIHSWHNGYNLQSSYQRTEVHPLFKKYSRIALKDLTEREVVIAVIAQSSKLRLLSHHQYKTIGHLMIFLIHFIFTFTLIYSTQLLYRSNTIALSF